MDDDLTAQLPGLPPAEPSRGAFLDLAYIGMLDAHLADSNYTAEELREAMVAPHVRRCT